MCMLVSINAVQLNQLSSELRHHSLFLVVCRARHGCRPVDHKSPPTALRSSDVKLGSATALILLYVS